MCNCHSILECYVMFSGVKLSTRSFNLFQPLSHRAHRAVSARLILSYRSRAKVFSCFSLRASMYWVYDYTFFLGGGGGWWMGLGVTVNEV